MRYILTHHARQRLKDRFSLLDTEIDRIPSECDFKLLVAQHNGESLVQTKFMGYDIVFATAPEDEKDETILKSAFEIDHVLSQNAIAKANAVVRKHVAPVSGEEKQAKMKADADERKRLRREKHEEKLRFHAEEKHRKFLEKLFS